MVHKAKQCATAYVGDPLVNIPAESVILGKTVNKMPTHEIPNSHMLSENEMNAWRAKPS